jgi:allantoinase
MTIYACALALERNLPAAQTIKEAGYDICCHGWRWIEHYRLTNNDLRWGTANLATGEDFFAILREAFDLLYEEGREKPKMMNVGMHMRLLGHPGRASGLARFLDYASGKPDVWICKREDIARHWLKEHPCEIAS